MAEIRGSRFERMPSFIPRNLFGTAVLGVLFLLGSRVVMAAPANDSLSDATTVSGDAFALAADLLGATRESFEPQDARLPGMSVWWRWMAPQSGTYGWDASGSPKRTHVSVVATDPLAQWHLVGETYLRPSPGFGFQGGANVQPDPTGSFVAVKGETYWLRLDGVREAGLFEVGQGGEPTPYPVAVTFTRLPGTPPAHDEFSRRIVLGDATPVLEGSLALAASEAGEPAAHAASLKRTLWWEWTAPGRGTAVVRFADTAVPPLVTVYRRAPWQQLQAFASSATEFGNQCDRFWHARAELEFDVEPGETCFLQVDAFPDRDVTLPFRGQLSFVPSPSNDLLASPTEVTGLDWNADALNEGATGLPGDPLVPGQSGSSSIWYRWNLPSRGLVEVTTGEPTVFAEPDVEILPPPGTGGGGVVTIFEPGPCSAPFEDLHPRPAFVPVLAVFRRFGSSGDLPLLEYQRHGTNQVWAEMTGTEAWIQMDGPQGVTGRARLNAHLTPPPRNDARAAAIQLPSDSVRVTGRTAGATAEPGEALPADAWVPAGFGRDLRRTVWWRWQAPSAGLWAMRIGAGLGDNYFVIYRQEYRQGAVPVVLTLGEPTLFEASAGETFEIGVFSVWGLGTNVEFRVQPATPPPLGPPRLEVDAFTGRVRWLYLVPRDWNLPFAGETSPDLRSWTPVPIDWAPGYGEFRMPYDPEAPAQFLRLRVGPP